MKIAIIGYSGSGKSTLARKLAEHHKAPVLHLDAVHHLPGWQERDAESEKAIIGAFLDENDSWIIDGNYSRDHYERRMEEADLIIMMLFNRISCFARAYRRYKTYKNTTRPDMAEGCPEKFDRQFALWILWNGRSQKALRRYRRIRTAYGEKVIIIQNQRQLDRFEKSSISNIIGMPK